MGAISVGAGGQHLVRSKGLFLDKFRLGGGEEAFVCRNIGCDFCACTHTYSNVISARQRLPATHLFLNRGNVQLVRVPI